MHRLTPLYDTIRYDTRCYFNVRSKADISQLNLPIYTAWFCLRRVLEGGGRQGVEKGVPGRSLRYTVVLLSVPCSLVCRCDCRRTRTLECSCWTFVERHRAPADVPTRCTCTAASTGGGVRGVTPLLRRGSRSSTCTRPAGRHRLLTLSSSGERRRPPAPSGSCSKVYANTASARLYRRISTPPNERTF